MQLTRRDSTSATGILSSFEMKGIRIRVYGRISAIMTSVRIFFNKSEQIVCVCMRESVCVCELGGQRETHKMHRRVLGTKNGMTETVHMKYEIG